jgi:hypothetical protein
VAEEASPDEERLELGPRWAGVATALAWVRFGVTAIMAGFALHLVAALLGFLDETLQQLFVLVQNLTLAAAGFSLFIGQLLCLRVPAGTRARPAIILSLVARLLAFGLSLYGGIAWLETEATPGTGRDADRLTAFALLLGGWAVSLVAELLLLAFLRRVGRFLGDGVVVRQAQWATWILVAYALVSLALGAAGVAWIYQVVLDRIAAHKAEFPMADDQPFSWLLSHLSGVLSPWKGAPAAVALAHLIASAVAAGFWAALASRYRAALRAAITTIEAGLLRAAIR